ncbi:uncharacterized protein LOC122396588 [Colletes gigas]|uniref:uncharacterized protein LOC122396588 n=1 Tax=Colletes gigas TaxID=935657 RepID=UPI001C9B2DEA|nr:uncharacterized protein LOC122396588 [Colletes gigas]
MDVRAFEYQHFRINKFFGQIIGIWPGQSKLSRKVAIFTMYTVIITAVGVQITNVSNNYTFKNLTDQLPYVLLGVSMCVKYSNYVINSTKLKDLLHSIIQDWQVERSQVEVVILELYSRKAVTLSLIYAVTICFTALMFAILPAMPRVLDIFLPLNESRDRVLIFPAYYYVDQDKYYYFIIAHEIMGAMAIALIFSGCDVNLIWYRFQHALGEKCTYYEESGRAVKAKDYVNVADVEMTLQYFTFCVFMVAQVIHVLFFCLMGQWITDATEESYDKIYESYWHNGSTRTQLLYIMVLRRSLMPPGIKAGGLLLMNLNTFVQLLKASFSYYTVLQTHDELL